MEEQPFKIKRAYKELFSSPLGKVVLKDLMRECSFLQPTYMPGDALTSAFNEGRRRIILRIINFIHKDEAELAKILEENIKQYEEYND